MIWLFIAKDHSMRQWENFCKCLFVKEPLGRHGMEEKVTKMEKKEPVTFINTNGPTGQQSIWTENIFKQIDVDDDEDDLDMEASASSMKEKNHIF